ncbi:MarR family transcriptional regulator [Streptomyces sp. NBC_01356]|uniref:MarR family winged helix-turn-helix transcriptional regulator n=1 Tax=Streptomyces sp. NBC_01356 TaxID=2903836 RepID=UPI002E33225B|nr:MarR family transcriptional regulator [Streptomyces sp. NBC_01356]
MSSEVGSVTARLGVAVQAYQGVVDDFDRELARLLGVNETGLRCLELLLEGEEVAPGWLAAKLGLTTGSVTTLLDRLEQLDYLTRTPHPTDRRRALVRITPQASERAFGLIAPFLDDSARILTRFTPEQLELVAAFLRASRETTEVHVQRLRDMSATSPKRSGGRQAPGPRGSARSRA